MELTSSFPSDQSTGQRVSRDQTEFNWDDALSALSALSLTWVRLVDYVVVMNGKMDVIIYGEPHIALQLWFNMKSCQFLSRVWCQTVAYGKVNNITQFMEACSNHFQGRPCLGYLLGHGKQQVQEFVVSQFPVPRRISQRCLKVLDKNASDNITSCHECLKLGDYAQNILETKEELVSATCLDDKYYTRVDNIVDMKHEHDLNSDSKNYFEEKPLTLEQDTQQEQVSMVTKTREKVLNTEDETDMHEDTFDADYTSSNSDYNGQNCLKEYICENADCGYKAASRLTLKRHCQRLSHQYPVFEKKTWSRVRKCEGKFTCDSADCGYRSNLRRNLMEHCRRFSHYSSQLTASQSLSVLQRSTPTSERQYFNDKKCEICGKTLACDGFRTHMKKAHGKTGKFKKQCDICKNEFSTGSFDEHAMKQHFCGKFLCAICKFRGNLAMELVNHMNEEHKDDLSVQCPSCQEDNPLKDIELHYKSCITHKIKLKRRKPGFRMCDTCGKVYAKRSYQAHVKTHLRKKAENGEEVPNKTYFYYCEKCGKRYGNRAALRHHVQSAHDKIEYPCPLCPMTFETLNKRRAHKNMVHSTDMKYECKHCGLRCRSEARRKAHETVHEDPKFECRFCKKGLKSIEALEAHERYHTGEKPFKCEVCGNTYVSSNRLYQHIAGVHKMPGPRGGRPGWRRVKRKQ